MESKIGKRIFCSNDAFSNFVFKNFDPLFEGSEAIIFKNEDDIIKIFHDERKETDSEMEAQKELSNLEQDTFVCFDSFYMIDDHVIAGTHKYIKGSELICKIRETDLDELGKFVKKVNSDTKIISNAGIVIRDALTFNVLINNNGIFFIDTTRFLKCNPEPSLYNTNNKAMMTLIDNDLFHKLPKKEILKPIRKELLDLYLNYQDVDIILPEIKKEYSKYFDSEVSTMQDIAYNLSKKT